MGLPRHEGERFLKTLDKNLPITLDGRQTILALKAANYQWRQMEWIGWGFEYLGSRILKDQAGAVDGPAFGRTRFDIRGEFVWDLKAHPDQAPSCILNDAEAVESCIDTHGGVGFLIASGPATYDENGTFKQWHDTLKERTSAYETARIKRGAPSRMRKTQMTLSRLDAFWIPDDSSLRAALRSGLLGFFQEGMRNADGSPRRKKYLIHELHSLRESEIAIMSVVRGT